MQTRVFLKKGDGIVLLAVIAAALLLWLLHSVIYPAATDGVVEITANGTHYGTFPLDTSRTFTVETANGGKNTIHIENGQAWVTGASCPDRLCERQGAVSRRGETVVCLPNGLVLTVRDGKQGDVDFIVR